MAQTITVPEATYTPGTYGPFELRQLPGNAQGFKITFTRVNWPAGHCLTIVTEWSRDNGTTWEPDGEVTFAGGDLYFRGVLQTTCGMAAKWPGEAGPNGLVTLKGTDVRVTAVVAQTITTAITVEAI